MITFSEEALKVCEHTFFQEIQTKSSVTCNLPVQLQLGFLEGKGQGSKLWEGANQYQTKKIRI